MTGIRCKYIFTLGQSAMDPTCVVGYVVCYGESKLLTSRVFVYQFEAYKFIKQHMRKFIRVYPKWLLKLKCAEVKIPKKTMRNLMVYSMRLAIKYKYFTVKEITVDSPIFRCKSLQQLVEQFDPKLYKEVMDDDGD